MACWSMHWTCVNVCECLVIVSFLKLFSSGPMFSRNIPYEVFRGWSYWCFWKFYVVRKEKGIVVLYSTVQTRGVLPTPRWSVFYLFVRRETLYSFLWPVTSSTICMALMPGAFVHSSWVQSNTSGWFQPSPFLPFKPKRWRVSASLWLAFPT